MSYDILLIDIHKPETSFNFKYDGYIGINLLAAFLSENGFPAKTFTGKTHEIEDVLQKEIKNFDVKMIGLSCDYENQTTVSDISKYIKNKYGIPVIIGGPQAIALDKDFLLKSKCDVIVRGEGEITLLELLNYFINGTGQLEKIKGITFLKNSACHRTNDRELIKRLDLLPFKSAKYSIGGYGDKMMVSVLTGRGCPFSCSFCYEGSNSRQVRYRSVENVMQEIDTILEERKLNDKSAYIIFVDDTFTLDMKRVEQFCQELKKRKEKYNLVWFCEAHISTLYKHPEIISKMVEAGLIRMQLGVESGSEKVLKYYNKGITTDQIIDVVKNCVKAGVAQLTANFIIGGAGETNNTIKQSLALAKKLLSIANGIIDLRTVYFWPFPNTPITNNPDDYQLKIVDTKSNSSINDYPLVNTYHLTQETICNKKKEFDDAIYNLMKKLKYSTDWNIIKKQYELAEKYHITNLWYSVFIEESHWYKYFNGLIKGYYKHSSELNEKDLFNYKPIRTFNIQEMQGKRIKIGGSILTEFETEIILLSAGNLTLTQITKKLFEKFPEKCYKYLILKKIIKKTIDKFEKNFWLLFSKF